MEDDERPRKILKTWTDSACSNRQVPCSTRKKLERKFRRIASSNEIQKDDAYVSANAHELNIHAQNEFQRYEEGRDSSTEHEAEGNNSKDQSSNITNDERMYFSDSNNSFQEEDYDSDTSNFQNNNNMHANDNNVEGNDVLFDLDFTSQPAFNGSQVTVGEVHFLMETFASSEGLTDKSLGHMLKIMQFILGQNNLPSSLYHYEKIFSGVLSGINYYICCLKCENVIVKAKRYEMNGKPIECEVCETKRQKNLREGVYYVIFDLKRLF